MTSEVKQQQLEWRRAQVLELASEGYTQREIANKLHIDLAAVNRDIQFLRQQAQEHIQKHIHETVPEEYQKCMTGMKRNLKQTLEIAETVADPKIKLQAHAIVRYLQAYHGLGHKRCYYKRRFTHHSIKGQYVERCR